jgi:hypothetical protein
MDAVAAYGERLVNRGDTYCVQQPTGRYVRRSGVVDGDLLADHLAGVHTLALDSVGVEGLTRWGVCDSDVPDGLSVLQAIWSQLTVFGLSALLEGSRRGGHLWVLFSTPQPAIGVRRVLHAAVVRVGVRLEVYPNTDKPPVGGVAQPVRLPLGVHQVTGQRYSFLDQAGRTCHRDDLDAALAWFLAQPRTTTAQLQTALIGLGEPPSGTRQIAAVDPPVETPRMGGGSAGATYGAVAWAKRQSLLWLIATTSPAVALRRAGRGYIGWCPWHDDASPQEDGSPGTPSLYVYCDVVHGWRWKCLSRNCGAYQGRVKDAFDWLVWCQAGSTTRALAYADTLQGKEPG